MRYILFAAPKTISLMGTKQNDFLAAKPAFFQEGKDRHRHCTPIIWKTELQRFILLYVFRVLDQLRAGVSLLIAHGLIDALRIVF